MHSAAFILHLVGNEKDTNLALVLFYFILMSLFNGLKGENSFEAGVSFVQRLIV